LAILSVLQYLTIYEYDNETALIDAIKMNSQDSFHHVYEKYSGAIWYLILQQETDEQVAMKLLGIGYKEIFIKIADYNPVRERFFTSIYKITVHALKIK
jgi:hypothetical protein